MIHRFQIRGFGEEVLFAERYGEYDKVFKLYIDDNNSKEAEKTEIFHHD